MSRAEQLAGPALIGLAAILWASDAPFRLPALQKIDATWLVFLEHLIAMVALAIWAWVKKPEGLFKLAARDWLALFLIGAGASAAASVFFTASFRYVNPSVTILLQKLQPVIVVLMAYGFLGERPKPGFYTWAVVALGAGLVLSFPDLNFSFLKEGFDVHSRGVAYALSAAGLWATATVVGKSQLGRQTPSVVTFWRYFFGLSTLGALLMMAGSASPIGELGSPQLLGTLAYISLLPGLVAMVCYYQGLSRATASITTVVELLYPITAVILNTVVLNSPLNLTQLAAGFVLLIAMTRISFLN